MNRLVAIVGVTVLAVCLIGWAALAWAQPEMEKETASSAPPTEPGGAGPMEAAGPLVDMPGKTVSSSPPLPPSSGEQPLPPMRSATTPKGPGMPPTVAETPRNPVPPGPRILPLPGQPAPVDPLLGPESEKTATPPSKPPQPMAPPQPSATLPSSDSAPKPSTASPPDKERPAEESLAPENVSSRQEPAVSIEWIGPTSAKIGQANAYSLIVRNACNSAVQQVLVRVRVPAGVTCAETTPKANNEGNVLVWELGTLLSRQEKDLRMKLVPEQKGDVTPQAWVTFTGSSVLRIKVCEPKLAVKVQGPRNVLVGETATIVLRVSNPGDGVAEQVKIHAALSEGLEHARGSNLLYDIGNLAGGETRNVAIPCLGKLGGAQKCDVAVEANGGLRAKDSIGVRVSAPRLELHMSGPALRYLGRKALYTLKVNNPGDAPARNVTVSDVVPEGFKVLAASDGGRYDVSARTVSWFLGEIGAGQAHEVKLEVQAVNPGEFKHKANAAGVRGLAAESEWVTRVEGLSALMLEMVDTEDPIEVGSETAYEVRITNTGSKVETNIKLEAVIPDKMEFKNAVGPVRFHAEGKTIVFEPLEKLAPRADAIFRINVKAVDAGIVRFKIQMTSTHLTEPVIKMEATRIYSDAPEVKPAQH